EVTLALLLGQPSLRFLVRREDRSGGAELRDHVRDGAALRVAERRDAGARELEDRAAPTADGAAAQELEDHVLGLDPWPVQLVLQEDADDLRTRQLKRVPGHADRHVEA